MKRDELTPEMKTALIEWLKMNMTIQVWHETEMRYYSDGDKEYATVTVEISIDGQVIANGHS